MFMSTDECIRDTGSVARRMYVCTALVRVRVRVHAYRIPSSIRCCCSELEITLGLVKHVVATVGVNDAILEDALPLVLCPMYLVCVSRGWRVGVVAE